MVVVVAQARSARVLLVVMVPSASIVGVVLPPLVHSYGGTGVQEPNVEVLYVEEPSGFR
jgi:hypothetical protein